jgi:hypothetical protein
VVRMDMAASYALTIADRRAEAQEKLIAEELLQVSRNMGRHGQPEPVEIVPEPVSAGADLLAEQLVEALMEVVDR